LPEQAASARVQSRIGSVFMSGLAKV
jgi:hypothetical protein